MLFRKNPIWNLYRGSSFVIAGVLLLLLPGIALSTLVFILGAVLVCNGVVILILAKKIRQTAQYGIWLILSVIMSIIAGVLILFNPFTTAVVVVYLVGIWLFIGGLAEIIVAIRLKNMARGEQWYLLAGAFAILFSLIIFTDPSGTIFLIAFCLGTYLIINGCMIIYHFVSEKGIMHDIRWLRH